MAESTSVGSRPETKQLAVYQQKMTMYIHIVQCTFVSRKEPPKERRLLSYGTLFIWSVHFSQSRTELKMFFFFITHFRKIFLYIF